MGNKNYAPKNSREIAWKNVESMFKRYGLKEMSLDAYTRGVKRFCQYANIDNPFNFPRIGLERIEDLTTGFIADNREKLAPKYLNVIFCAVKRWCQIQGMVKSTKAFKEIKFDKSSRKTRDHMMLTKAIVRKLFNNANLAEKVILAFYGINGLRPSLIPQLLVEDINPKDVTLTADSVGLAEKAWIWVKREYEGNRANMDFPIMTTAEESVWIEEHLNTRIRKGEVLTRKSQIVLVKNKRAVDYVIDKLFDIVGFEGRNYLLRHYAYKQLKRACEDYDLREWLMGHKGKISAIYDHEHYLTNEEINEYKAMVDTKELHVYGLGSSQEQVIEARIQTIKALVDLDKKELDPLRNELARGKITIEQFNESLTRLSQKAMNRQIERRFEKLFVRMNDKYNGQ